MENIIFHIDVNNAFLSWTAIDYLNHGYKYDIRKMVAVIGGNEERRAGIVLAKSIEAKKCNIKTAETLYSARKKFKNLKVFPPNYKFYEEMSSKLFNLLSKYTPDIEIASIDECYLDYGKVKNLYGDEAIFANKLKEEIKNTLGFTVNIGIANNKLCAKMASDFLKPDKVHTLYDYEIKDKMYPLDIDDLFGVGKSTGERLKQLKINTIGDLAQSDPNNLKKYFKNQVTYLIERAKGVDNSMVNATIEDPVSISNETTLVKDTDDVIILKKHLFDLSEQLGERVRKQNKYASTVAIILKDNLFKRKNHQKKLKNPINSNIDIYKASCMVFDEMVLDQKVRLIGIRLDNLVDNKSHQISLFEPYNESEEKLDKVIDNLKDKYGNDIIKKINL
ncbi:MAG TPA: DNA polymerase IV [Bacilli bacterium]|nr:DNA polymerase IV [Bacilli bacterium]